MEKEILKELKAIRELLEFSVDNFFSSFQVIKPSIKGEDVGIEYFKEWQKNRKSK